MAKRQNGVSQGSLLKTITSSMSSTNNGGGGIAATFVSSFTSVGGGGLGSSSLSASSSTTAANGVNLSTYSLLIGVKLICYENIAAMLNGDHPIAQYCLVGASAVSDDPTSFRAVTDRGTHLLCSAPTRGCRGVWLSALNAGIEFRLLEEQEGQSEDKNRTTITTTTTTPRTIFPPVRPKFPRGVKQKKSSPSRYCRSCGKVELNRSSGSYSYHPAPLPQYGFEERVDLCARCHMAQGVVEHCDFIEELYSTQQQEQRAMLEARRLVLDKLGRIPNKNTNIPATNGKNKDNNNNNDVEISEIEESESTFGETNEDSSESIINDDDSDRDATGRLLPKSHILQLRPLSHHIMGLVYESPQGVALQRLSPTLCSLCTQFQQGMIGVLEFMELLEAAIGIRDPTMAELKKQAFRVAGDMGTALKLLYEQCLPPVVTSGNNSLDSLSSHHRQQSGSNNLVSTELLQCILEFFLDLVVEENELNTLAFFWPQICNIHLQMLPPKDTLSLQKIELVEDFLLTVASKYSIHLAIELVWSHTADLQDASSGSYNDSTTTYCGHRKSAVIRFLCELESLLFDFDTGWGGGSVTVGQYMSPSNHQIELLKPSISRIQTYRLAAEHDRLTRSHRMDKLQKLMTYENKNDDDTIEAASPEMLAKEALRIANNADYLTSHLAYTKRLCDITESLRFLPIEDRKSTLTTELAKLNASGTMGGDPINVVKGNDQGHTRVVRIPITEGHVFRSKARTPVLLLVETIDEVIEVVKVKSDVENINRKENSDVVEAETATKEISVINSDLISNQEELEETAATETTGSGDTSIQNNVNDEEQKEYSSNKDEGGKITTDFIDTAIQTKSNDGEAKDGSSDQEKAEIIDVEEITGSLYTPTQSDVDDEEESCVSSNKAEEEKILSEVSAEDINIEADKESTLPQNEVVHQTAKVDSATKDTLSSRNENIKINEETHRDEVDQARDILVATPVEDRKIKITETIFEDVVMPDLDTITRSKRLGSYQSIDTSGSLTESHDEKAGIARHALRRFDSPKSAKIVTPTADRKLVENLMTCVVAKQLHLPNLMKQDSVGGDGKECQDADLDSLDQESLGLDTQEQGDDQSVDNGSDDNQRQQSNLPKHAKMKNLGAGNNGQELCNSLSKTGETRREVLNAIMTKGMSGSHVIAEQAATGAKRHLQDLERRVAVEALLTGESEIPHGSIRSPDKDERRQELLSLGIRSASLEDIDSYSPNTDDDEAMEAIRLLLIQYRVANGSISANDAAVVLAPHPKMRSKKNGRGTIMHFGREFPEIDAGDVDSRLIGCGVLKPAVLQALTLWKGEMISSGELLELVKKDLEFEKNTNRVGQNTDKLNEDSAFWGRFAFGERWAEKKARIAASSPDAAYPGWDLNGIIVKSNDDLRQEAFVMQLIELCHEAFQEAELELWLLPYRIVSTSRSTGIMELIRNSMSFDGLKKRPGYGTGGIRDHLKRMTQYAANPSEAFQFAQRNFVRSLAAYSLLSYLFLFKDRHNGNIMLDTAGHVIHIDFGFVFGIAPGGNFGLERSTPFKLTEEMIEVMDGLRSSLFSEFVTLFCCGFLALQAHCGTFVTLVEVTSRGSTFPCFDGKDSAEIISKMQERFCPELSKEETIAHVLDVIKESIGSYGTKQYDYFQYVSQGIAT